MDGRRTDLKDRPKEAHRMQKFLSAGGHAKLDGQSRRFQERVMKDYTQARWMRRLAEIYSELKVDFTGSKPRILGLASA